MSGACPAPMPDLIVPKNKNKSKNYFASQNTPYIPSPEGRGFTAFFGKTLVDRGRVELPFEACKATVLPLDEQPI